MSVSRSLLSEVEHKVSTDTFLTDPAFTQYQVKFRKSNGTFCIKVGSAFLRAYYENDDYFGDSYMAPRDTMVVADDVWKFKDGSHIFQGVVVDSSGNVFCAGVPISSENVFKLNSSGSQQWSFNTQGAASGIDVSGAGNVYVAGARAKDNNSVWMLNSSGVEQWGYDTLGNAYKIAVDGSGNAYIVGTRAGGYSVWAVDSSGNELWKYDTGDDTWAVAVDSSGDIYVAGETTTIIKLDSSGAFQWSDSPGPTGKGVCLDSSDNIYLAYESSPAGQNIRKYNSSHVAQWTFALESFYAINTLVADNQGHLYSSGNPLIKLETDTGDISAVYLLGGENLYWSESIDVDSNGFLYVARSED
jgi:hypothetical protein